MKRSSTLLFAGLALAAVLLLAACEADPVAGDTGVPVGTTEQIDGALHEFFAAFNEYVETPDNGDDGVEVFGDVIEYPVMTLWPFSTTNWQFFTVDEFEENFLDAVYSYARGNENIELVMEYQGFAPSSSPLAALGETDGTEPSDHEWFWVDAYVWSRSYDDGEQMMVFSDPLPVAVTFEAGADPRVRAFFPPHYTD